MKLFSAEKTGLRTEYIKFLLACFLLLFSENIFSQIPFKGFGKLSTVKTDSAFTKLFSFNFNNDEYSDLLLFSPFHKSIQVSKGLSGAEFSIPIKKQSPVEISNIEPVLNNYNQIENYAVTSRRQRSFCLISFNSNGSIAVKEKISFDTYPENLSVSFNRFENDYEYLISGNSFRGLSVIKKKNKKLESAELFADKIFQNAKFIDLNSDGAEDIIAVDAINNQLLFIFRNSKGEFENLRQISFDDQIVSLAVFDINYDQFKDIVISTSSSIEIIFGDSFSSFNKSAKIKTLYQADKIVIGDFNRDGFFDFNYLNRETGIVATIFANDFTNYNSELIHLKDKAIKDLIAYFSKFIYGTAAISDKGEIRILSKVNSLSESQTLALGIMPDKIVEFDYQENGITDIAFTDNFNSSLNIILRDAYGLPEKFFSIKVNNNYENILVFSQSKTIKLFYLYNKGDRAIESIEVDCEKLSSRRRIIYSDGPIEDIAVKPDLNKEAIVYILYSQNGYLYFQQYLRADENYNSRSSGVLTKNFTDAFFISLTYPTIGYFTFESDNAILNTVENRRENLHSKKHFQISRNFKSLYTITSFTNLTDDRSFYSVVSYSNQQKIFFNNKITDEIYQYTSPYVYRITEKNHLFFGKSNSLFVYEEEKLKLTKLSFSGSGRVDDIKEKLSDIYLKDFLIMSFDQRKEYIIFSNSSNGTIGIKELL